MTTPDIYRDANYITDVLPTPSGAAEYDYGQEKRVKKAQSNVKVAIIDRLLRDLDILIYCELSALYYMEYYHLFEPLYICVCVCMGKWLMYMYSCSIILLLLRAIIQLIFFTPKAAPFDPTRNQPFIGAIFASNVFCMLFHTISSNNAEAAGEETRGYLHGGLFIDFIGQKAPVSVGRLLALDLLIVGVDLVMLGLVVERVKTVEKARGGRGSGSGRGGDEESSSSDGEETRQDHDSEERGVLRQNNSRAASADGIELDEFENTHTPASTHNNTPNNDNEHTTLLDNLDNEPTTINHTTRTIHPLDSFASGETMLMDLGLLDIIRDQWRYTPSTSSSSSSSPPSRATTTPSNTTRYVPSVETAAFLRERFGLQISADGRVERIER